MTLAGNHVHGDFRLWAKRAAGQERRYRWSKAGKHVSAVVRECESGIEPLCKIVRRRGSSEETILLLEALCARVPCGHRFARYRDGPAWPQGIWSCHACNSLGLETAEHVLECPANDIFRADAVERLVNSTLPTTPDIFQAVPLKPPLLPWVQHVRQAFALAGQVDTTPETRDYGFSEWGSWDPRDTADGSLGSGWDGPWHGQFMLCTPTSARTQQALQKAADAVRSHWPTR